MVILVANSIYKNRQQLWLHTMNYESVGEKLAADYLEAKVWRILHRDRKIDHKDLDIVCIDDTFNNNN